MTEEKLPEKNKDSKLAVDNPDLDDLQICKKEKEEYLNGWKRAKADLINYQKDEAQRIKSAVDFELASVLKDFLPVLDSLILAQSVDQKVETEANGLKLIYSQLLDRLRRQGFEKITVNLGDDFNPSLHEAVGTVKLSKEKPEDERLSDKIAQIISDGYFFKDRVLRPTKIKIGKFE